MLKILSDRSHEYIEVGEESDPGPGSLGPGG